MQTLSYEGLFVEKSNPNFVEDHLVIEAPLQININEKPYTVVMRTPKNDEELIRGLLYAEDIYKGKANLIFNTIAKENSIPTIINITINQQQLGKGYLNKRTLLSVSSCGICGKQKLEDITVKGIKMKNETSFSAADIHSMFVKMDALQYTFRTSGGSHAAAIFNKNKQLLTCKEDIGRHNAVDKTIGFLLIKNQLQEANYLLVSGRVSYEIISKAFLAKIPVVVAVSACSSLAVDFAKEFGICLIGFTRADKLTVYSKPSALKILQHD